MILRSFTFFVASAFLAAAEQHKPLTPLDVFELELPAAPQIAPDGKRVIYVRESADIMTDRRYSSLWVVSTDDKGHRPMTSGKFRDTNPVWSEDGGLITFISDRDGSPQIYRLWLDTGHIAKLTNLTAPPSNLALSPDGKWIAFTMHVPEKASPIAKMPAAPEGAKWAEPAKVIDSTYYRFNGAGYLKPGYQHIFVVSGEGGTPRQISNGKFQHGGPLAVGSSLEWTRDSKSILIGVNRESFEKDPRNTEIYEFSVADGTSRALTSRKGPDLTPTVSPDGRFIAYLGFEDRFLGNQSERISVMNRDGSGSRLLTPKLAVSVNSIAWSPDSKGMYFVADEKGNTGLYYCALDGPVKKITGNLGAGRSASGGNAGLSVAKSGAVAFTSTRPDRPGDIAFLAPGATSPRLLTTLNQDLLTTRKLGPVEEIWYESSRDQRRIQGWVIKPPDFDPTKKYPLILEIHGGPFSNYGDRFDLEKQMMAASGYVVLYTNPRGSTSYGEDFANLIHHAYPGDDFYDLNSGVDAMIAKGYIDPEQLFVTGGSGGGVLTCWMIGKTPRFRAAATLYPVINWYSWMLTSDIGPIVGRYWFPGMPWDNVEHFEKRSLLSVVKNVKTPTMVLTGESDYRTPMSDSEQYYQALRMLGVESVLVRVPDEPHGVSVRPSHHISKMLHIIGWFDQHRSTKPPVVARKF
ncbi:MAG: S9 family peptidase [Bryobacteraceae bacterium]|nr:S9 family peptidase [Bryobacteraceae bacterium]